MIKIKSDSSDQYYDVDLIKLTCTCKDYIMRKAKIKGMCKHILKAIKENTKSEINYKDIIKQDNDAISFIEKYGEEELVILKKRGEIIEKHGKLILLE